MKKTIAISMIAILLTCSGITVQAEHKTSEGAPCNNTHYTLVDGSTVATTTGTHNYTCTVTYYVKTHTKYCSSCGTSLGAGPSYRCTEIHTCGNIIRDCTGVH